jgi:magnesium and cobalt exporter, CNNM family
MVQRDDGSWLVDGGVSVERLKSVLDIDDELPDEDENEYNTVGGFVMHTLGRIPVTADHFDCVGLRFEVMDMDRTRVDKVMVSRRPEAEAPAEPV